MTCVWLLLCCLWMWMPPGQSAQGYHRQSARTINPAMLPTHASFGYSVTYVPAAKRLIVSAPQVDNLGQVYSCDINDLNCAIVQNNVRRYDDNRYNQSYWFGATVKAGQSYFVTCAPLYIISSTYRVSNLYIGTHSRCYKYTGLPDDDPVTLLNMTLISRLKDTDYYEQSMETFGWSIDVAEDNVIIGGPAMFTGRALKYYDLEKYPVALNGLGRADFNFGYSVAAGYFYVSKKNVLSYAISSPYGISGYGKVSLYLSPKPNTMVHKVDLESPDVEQVVGSMFGAVMCAVRVAGGNMSASALIVGAPTYATKELYNIGAVYIYAPSDISLEPTFLKRIVGYHEGSYFGSAIVSIGDLDGDGKDEFAIAAPYENSGVGAVYLYSSAVLEDKQDASYMQKIEPTQRDSMKSFGLSLSAVQDFDENGCNELAIGAPESNKVMILQCIASVRVELFEEIDSRKFVDGKPNPLRTPTSFHFNSCLRAWFPEKPYTKTAHIKVQVQILDHPNVTLRNGADKEYHVRLNREGTVHCKKITIDTPKGGNYGTPITYIIKATQQNPPNEKEDFDATHLLVNSRSKLESTGLIYLADCNNTDNCMPDLEFSQVKLSEQDPYVIGSTDKIDVDVVILNKGEVAYEPCLRAEAAGLPTARVPSGCARTNGTDSLLCAPKMTMQHGDRWFRGSWARHCALVCQTGRLCELYWIEAIVGTSPIDIYNISGISFEVSHLTNLNGNMDFSFKLYNHCSNLTAYTTFTKQLSVTTDTGGIIVKGLTDTGGYDVSLTEGDARLGKAFQQTYTISNFGQTNWVGITAELIVQKRSFINNTTKSAITRMNDAAMPKVQNCELVRNRLQEDVYTCKIGNLPKSSVAKITVPFFIEPKTIATAIQDKVNTIYTQIAIDFNGSPRQEVVQSTLVMLRSSVPIWVIIMTSLLALIVLFIIFFSLKQCGFFQRKAKEQLKNEKINVRRQTIMRRSTSHESRPPSSPDKEALIEVAKAAAERGAAKSDKRLRLD